MVNVMKPKLIVTLAILVTLSGVTIPVVGTHSQGTPTQLSQTEALSLVRALSTTQAEKKVTDHTFASLEKLSQHRALQRRLEGSNLLDAHSASIKDYILSVVTSADGQHFQLSLAPKSGCGYSLFTNESFVIYEAKALGCGG
jgi:hypothetical protein